MTNIEIAQMIDRLQNEILDLVAQGDQQKLIEAILKKNNLRFRLYQEAVRLGAEDKGFRVETLFSVVTYAKNNNLPVSVQFGAL